MKQFILTIKNCFKIRDFKMFRLLYTECPLEIFTHDYTSRNSEGFINVNMVTGVCNFISINGKISIEKRRTVVLHELGHYIDFNSYCTKKVAIFEFGKHSHDREARCNLERIAWRNAFDLQDKYNINMDLNFAKKGLDSYGTTYEKIEQGLK